MACQKTKAPSHISLKIDFCTTKIKNKRLVKALLKSLTVVTVSCLSSNSFFMFRGDVWLQISGNLREAKSHPWPSTKCPHKRSSWHPHWIYDR